MFKKITYVIVLAFFVTSCADTFGSVKRGLTGSKKDSTDEFLVEKKDPLILPPDFENLPIPDEEITGIEEVSIFEKTLEDSTEENLPVSDSVENSILRKIQSKYTFLLCEEFIERYPSVLEEAKDQKGKESFYKRRTPVDSELNINKSILDQINLHQLQ